MSTVAKTTPTGVENAPRRSTLRALSIIFILVAMLASGYLTYAKLTNQIMICVENSTVFNCEVVENSAYAYIMGIPTALLGFLTYSTIMALLILENRVAFLREYGLILIFGISLFAFAYHCFLTYTAFVTLRALCPWCLTAHTMVTLHLIVTGIRLWRSLKTAE
jgi:uncharacterized membrane protein